VAHGEETNGVLINYHRLVSFAYGALGSESRIVMSIGSRKGGRVGQEEARDNWPMGKAGKKYRRTPPKPTMIYPSSQGRKRGRRRHLASEIGFRRNESPVE